jgi:dUTP pyrophosphatase
MSNKLFVKRLHENAMLPTRGSKYSAGLDLFSIQDTNITPFSNNLVPTGISVLIPVGYYGRIAPRSGVSVKTGLLVNAGVIDSDYRGEIKIVFQNPTTEHKEIKKGDKVAQLIIEKIALLDVQEVDTLDYTERGSNGFGSTDTYVSER